jgi:hypothetical protein
MFSNNDEKITHLVRLREEYTQRVSKNVEKLTRQIELLGQINDQLGGGPKGGKGKGAAAAKPASGKGAAAKPASGKGAAAKPASGKGAAAKPASGKGAAKPGASPAAASGKGAAKPGASPASPEVTGSEGDNDLNFVDQQVQQILDLEQLKAAKSSLGGDMTTKLLNLKTQITALTKGDEIGTVVKEIVEQVKALKIPEVKVLAQDTMTTLAQAAAKFATDGDEATWNQAVTDAKGKVAAAKGASPAAASGKGASPAAASGKGAAAKPASGKGAAAKPASGKGAAAKPASGKGAKSGKKK